MSQPPLQGQFAHAALPELRRMRVPERVHGNAVGIEPGVMTKAFEGFGKAAIAERLTAAAPWPTKKSCGAAASRGRSSTT